MFWSWLFLAVTVIGALFTFNAYLPRSSRGVLSIPSFFAGWLTSELSVHHFAWQVAATLFFIGAGALDAWPGWLGLGITLVSWAGLLALVPLSAKSEGIVEDALVEALGPDYRNATAPGERREPTDPRGRLVVPFLLTHPDVEVLRDLRYAPGAARRHLLDVYRPREALRGAPVLLQIHGGGWVIGDKREQALPLMLQQASKGWICVAANYRLSPKATFPDHLVDVKLAIRWIREHIEEYGGDPSFIAITGGSAGGHLSSLAALTGNDPEYQSGFESIDTSLRACVPFYGVYDWANRFELPGHEVMEKFLARMVMKKPRAEDPLAWEKASPSCRVHPDAPPFFVIHGSHDSLADVEEARRLVALLRETSKAPSAYAEIPGAQHAFEIFHSLRTRHVVHAVDRFLTHVHTGYRSQRAGV
jgi:acetyl esterase/lipase